jgi:hypothetical protein
MISLRDLSLIFSIFNPAFPVQKYIVLPLTAVPKMYVFMEIVVEWFCHVGVLILSALSIKKE